MGRGGVGWGGGKRGGYWHQGNRTGVGVVHLTLPLAVVGIACHHMRPAAVPTTTLYSTLALNANVVQHLYTFYLSNRFIVISYPIRNL